MPAVLRCPVRTETPALLDMGEVRRQTVAPPAHLTWLTTSRPPSALRRQHWAVCCRSRSSSRASSARSCAKSGNHCRSSSSTSDRAVQAEHLVLGCPAADAPGRHTTGTGVPGRRPDARTRRARSGQKKQGISVVRSGHGRPLYAGRLTFHPRRTARLAMSVGLSTMALQAHETSKTSAS
jgi:hypothetical protein